MVGSAWAIAAVGLLAYVANDTMWEGPRFQILDADEDFVVSGPCWRVSEPTHVSSVAPSDPARERVRTFRPEVVLESRPISWSEIVVEARPSGARLAHGMSGRVLDGDVACTGGRDQVWVYAPTGDIAASNCFEWWCR